MKRILPPVNKVYLQICNVKVVNTDDKEITQLRFNYSRYVNVNRNEVRMLSPVLTFLKPKAEDRFTV